MQALCLPCTALPTHGLARPACKFPAQGHHLPCCSTSSSAAGWGLQQQQPGCCCAPFRVPHEAACTVPRASSGDGASSSEQGPQSISLARRIPGVEYTFVLAGFLKILTIGGLAQSAPVDALRTAAGQMSPYLMVPVGLAMCFAAKVVVDNNLQESRRFMAALVAFLVVLYFGLYKVLYRYDPAAEAPRRTRAVSSSPVARVRAGAGDREIGGPEGEGIMLRGSRAYRPKPGKPGIYDDAAYFDGQYASQMEEGGGGGGARGGASGSWDSVSTAELDGRNPLRRQAGSVAGR